MSKRFHLPPQQSKSTCTPLWIPIVIGIVIGLGLGLLLNLTGVIRCASCSADQCSATVSERTEQTMQRELLGSMAVETESEPTESPETAIQDSVREIDETVSVESEPEVDKPAPRMEARDPDQPIRLQVLNGCGEKGIAKRVSSGLRKLGFDVRESRNAKHFRHRTSKIYDRSGNMKLAYRVANDVGIDSSLVDELLDGSLVDIDVTIVIGSDYSALNLGMNE